MIIRYKTESRPYSLRTTIAKERQRVRNMNYTAACDFTNCMLMADDLKKENKIREAIMLESAASAVRRANMTVWLLNRSVKSVRNRPVK